MIKLDFNKYSEKFKDIYFRYFTSEISNNEKKYLSSENSEVKNCKKGKKIPNQLKKLLEQDNYRNEEKEVCRKICENLKNILTGTPEYISQFLNEMNNAYSETSNEFKKKLKEIFVKYGYNRKICKSLSYKITEILDVKVCPYCNENFAYTIGKDKIRPQLDHFYPKNKYPFFAISLANLIPSCPLCNSKKGEEEQMISPFSIKNGFSDFKFTFTPDISLKSLTGIKLEKIEKHLCIEFIKHKERNIDVLKLKARYQKHRDIVAEILLKSKTINHTKEKMDNKVLGITDEETYRLIFCNYFPSSEKIFLQRPFSKLIFDIYSEINILTEQKN